ncbi:hypothetical protein F5Y16DRAFT_405076 [Xylariaceae sp. FL0255]|nr:hypothetical protein F5Y16DRAFT_405076 [Xylariaceae sp. FL0255]
MLRSRRCITLSKSPQNDTGVSGIAAQQKSQICPIEESKGLASLTLLFPEQEKLPSTASTEPNQGPPDQRDPQNLLIAPVQTTLARKFQKRPSIQSRKTTKDILNQGRFQEENISPLVLSALEQTQPTMRTYLVEVINTPSMQNPTERARVLLEGAFDAVLLVYDVGSRSSFETVADFHNEIPLRARGGRSALSQKMGGKGRTGRRKSEEVVVGIVGNKCDVDDVPFSVSDGLEPGSESAPGVKSSHAGASFEMKGLPNTNDSAAIMTRPRAASHAPPPISIPALSPTRPSAIPPSRPPACPHPFLPQQDYHHGLESRNSDVTAETEMGTISTTAAAAAAAVTAAGYDVMSDNGKGTQMRRRIGLGRRQVSRLGGEMVARTLLLEGPFFEVSARTGHNVDLAFEGIVREVVKQWEGEGHGVGSTEGTKRSGRRG